MPALVLIVDRLTLVRRSLRGALGARRALEAPGVREALRVLEGRRPGVAVVGPGQPPAAAIEIARELRAALSDVPVLIVARGADLERFAMALPSSGVQCLREDASALRLALAVRHAAGDDRGRLPPRISPRELQVLRLIALGHTSREVAEELSLSVRTVETHRANLLAKLGVGTRAGLVRRALDLDLVS